KLYADNCAECHGADRLGRLGPALLPENLGRMTGARAVSVVTDGRAATQMPGFADKLGKDEIAALAAFIASPLSSVPAWGAGEIEA
uniref:c-type cytochrome n=1 Tax=Streptomyces galilaeus TaxID=33899 RepID=UPI0038F6183E